jgi:hypothetical protein
MRQEYFPAAKAETATKFGEVARTLLAMNETGFGSLQRCRRDLHGEAENSRRVVRVLRERLHATYDEVAYFKGLPLAHGSPTWTQARRVLEELDWPLGPEHPSALIGGINSLPIARLEKLIQFGADVNATGPGGQTAMMTAARAGNILGIELLLGAGAPLDARDCEGRTALIHAAVAGRESVVALMLNQKADVNARTHKGNTAIDLTSDSAVSIRLLQAGAHRSSGGSAGLTALPFLILMLSQLQRL